MSKISSITIAKLEEHDIDGRYEETVYELRVYEDDNFLQVMSFSNPEEIVILRNALTTYINNNHLDQSEHEH